MRLNRLDLNLLVGLDVLLAECSITRAARRLCLSQSAASGILARLREYFGDELLVQSGRQMLPTPLALSLQAPVRDILRRIEQTVETAAEFDPAATRRHFRVAASDFVGSVLMTRLAARMHDAAPGAMLEILQPNERSLAQMERGEIDLLLMPERYLSRSHPSEFLFSSPFACIVWDSNPDVGAALDLDAYLRLGHVATSFGSQQLAFDDVFFKSLGLVRRVEVVCATFNLLPQFVIGTARVATLPRGMALQLARYYPVRVLAPPLAIPPIVECMQWHPSMEHDLAHAWLRAMLRDTASGAYCAAPSTQPVAEADSRRTGPSRPESRSGAPAA